MPLETACRRHPEGQRLQLRRGTGRAGAHLISVQPREGPRSAGLAPHTELVLQQRGGTSSSLLGRNLTQVRPLRSSERPPFREEVVRVC